MISTSSTPLVMLAILILASYNHPAQCKEIRETPFLKNDTISCYSTEDVTTKSKVRCGVTCSSQTDKLCVGFGYNDNRCELCLPCEKSSIGPVDVGDLAYLVTAPNFDAELLEDQLMYAPMDSISGGKSPAFGTEAAIVGGPTSPYLTEGKYGKAIFTPNSGTYHSRSIALGLHQNDCFGQVPICPKGLTMSLWFKAGVNSHAWPMLFSSTSVNIILNQESSGFIAWAYLSNGTHNDNRNYFVNNRITFNEWHHFGLTYSQETGWDIYYDGCKQTYIVRYFLEKIPTSNEFKLGRWDTGYAAEIHFDELRVWTSVKSPRFMWFLWRM